MRDNDHLFHAWCSNAVRCGHHSGLELETLADRLGWDFDTFGKRVELRYRLICSRCGARNPELIISPYSGNTLGASHNHHVQYSDLELATRDEALKEMVAKRNAIEGEAERYKGKRRRRRRRG